MFWDSATRFGEIVKNSTELLLSWNTSPSVVMHEACAVEWPGRKPNGFLFHDKAYPILYDVLCEFRDAGGSTLIPLVGNAIIHSCLQTLLGIDLS